MHKLIIKLILAIGIVADAAAIEAKPHFLELDNISLAAEEELALDPFLVLRTKIGRIDSPYELLPSLTYCAHLISGLDSDSANLDIPGIIEPDTYSENRVCIVNPQSTFENCNPYFCISTESSAATKIWWQISTDEHFRNTIPSNLERMQQFSQEIHLDMLSSTFLNPQQLYYFRAKVKDEIGWTGWSTPFPFLVNKPDQVKVHFDSCEKGGYSLSWEGACSLDTRYYVFASNALDFIPSIYSDRQINAIKDGEIVASELHQNLLCITAETSIAIGSQYAYYRIVAERKGIFSVPSSIVRFFDDGIALPRTALQVTAEAVYRTTLNRASSFHTHPDFNNARATKPKSVPDVAWKEMQEYMIPDNHPMKARLDQIFMKTRASSTKASLKKAGFSDLKVGPVSHVTVCKHDHLKGYLLKIVRDDENGFSDWKQCLQRASGSQAVRQAIRKHGYDKIMKCPKKWIYRLPSNPRPQPGLEKKHFILVVEEMDIYHRPRNIAHWKTDAVTEKLLKSLYKIIDELGLYDSVHAINVPFCHDGRIAFIDTEYHHQWPIPWDTLKAYLKDSDKEYWKELTKDKN